MKSVEEYRDERLADVGRAEPVTREGLQSAATESVLHGARQRESGLYVPPAAARAMRTIDKKVDQTGPIVIAPVGNDRADAIPHYARAMGRQTLKPEGYAFLVSPDSEDVITAIRRTTWGIKSARVKIFMTEEPFSPREVRGQDPDDPNRAAHFTRLRNRLRIHALAHFTQAPWFLSCDTDVMLDDVYTIEALRRRIYVPELDGPERYDDEFDAACPTTYLAPSAKVFNTGWFVAGDPGSPTRVFRRADENDYLSRKAPVQVHVPLAVFAVNRKALRLCSYSPHELGEDLGFADAMDRHGMTVAWEKDITARHEWGPMYS